jgi:hypothetical protein
MLAHIITYFLRIIITLIVLMSVYFVFALINYQSGFDGFVGMLLFQPLFALSLACITTFLVSILGLPLIFNKKLNRIWKAAFYPVALGIFIVLLLLVVVALAFANFISWNFNLITQESTAIFAWFSLAFLVIHCPAPPILNNAYLFLKKQLKSIF